MVGPSLEEKMNWKLRRKFVLLLIFALIIAACGGQTAEETTEPPETTEEEIEPIEEAVEEPEPTEEAEFTPEPDPVQSVAILVIDDFAGESEAEQQETDGDFCTITPEGQIFKGEGLIFKGEGLSWVSLAGVSHGEVVYDQLSELLSMSYDGVPVDSIAGSDVSAEFSWMSKRPIEIREIAGQFILLVPVDTQHYDSGIIADRVQVTMNVLNEYYGVDTFVWNMSFGFIPCEAAELEINEEVFNALIESDEVLMALSSSLDEAVEAEQITRPAADALLRDTIRLRHSIEAYEEYLQPIEQPDISTDPFSILSSSPITLGTGMARVMPIASAGNSGPADPFGPAAWPGNIAVGSENLDATKADYANNGEVIMPDRYQYNASTIVIGTSFAAPHLSFLGAKYLSWGRPLLCGGSAGMFEPPFNYDMWNNLLLDAAKAAYCPDFPSL